jgi:hypothetical protein
MTPKVPITIGKIFDLAQSGMTLGLKRSEENFTALEIYRTREGDCQVPAKHIEGNLKLGLWVANLRAQAKISAARRERLNALGFIWRVARYKSEKD